MTNNISQIAKFGYVAQNFLSAIYKLDQNKLVASQNKIFKQSIFLQFIKVYNNNIVHDKSVFSKNMPKRKQADISKIPLPILFRLSRLSKSILEKSKIYKKNLISSSNLLSSNKLYVQVFKYNIGKIFCLLDKIPLQP